jgi:eukaryotic-like serine/threonine-protein kinase
MSKMLHDTSRTGRRRNCWEVKKCGREPGGQMVGQDGVCPAASDGTFDGINSGRCGGRICWAVAGTLCGGRAQGTFAEKRASCLNCEFYQLVQNEEGKKSTRRKFLHFIDQEDRSPFFNKMIYRRVHAGERFVIQGAVEEQAYIIENGSCLVIVEKDGKLHPVDHYGTGDIVGGLGILTGEPRHAHVEAETDMDLWVLTRAQFDEITEKDPALLDFITELVADRLDSRRPTAYRVIGKYVTSEIIGRGAFSLVYRGFHQSLNMPVVIKMMRHDMALHTDFLQSFRNEAQIIAGLNHDHIVNVYDFEERYRTLFIIMEYLKGDTLKEMIERLRVLPHRLTVDFLMQICSALAYAHRQGIVHRDVNPSNILVQPNDHLKVLDFGLACPTGTEDFSSLGTAYYMAPEQIDGGPVDGRTDIYALGIMAFEMVTGRRPFPEDNLKSLLDLHLTEDVMDPKCLVADIPEGLRKFIVTAARCDPDRRYQDMDQAIEALRPLVLESTPYIKPMAIKRNSAAFIVNYTDDHRRALDQLMERFKTEARALGAEVTHVESQSD